MHPSLHDSGGWVTLEAMAAGRPVICLDLGGPALQVSEATGIKIPAISPPQVVADLASALKQLAGDPSRRHDLARRHGPLSKKSTTGTGRRATRGTVRPPNEAANS